MHDHRDLLRTALESGKTVSKKAKSRQGSRASSKGNSTTSSPPHSRNASRNASRNVSDDEDGFSDDTFSIASIDEILIQDDPEGISPEAWKSELNDRMDHLIERKRSSVGGREESLTIYNRILMSQYAYEEIQGKLEDLVTAFLKSIKSETSEKETVLALRAIAVTLVTSPSDVIYDAVCGPVKRTISSSESTASKTAAVHTLGAATFYGGASEDETNNVMDFFLAIAESDGHSVDAGDSSEVVTAALEEWGFLATQLEDFEEESESAMEAFVEQLDSSEASVQIAAGENIALLYEKSYSELEEDEEAPSEDELSDPEDETEPGGPKLIKRYTVYRREDQLKHSLAALANISGRSISKKDKKSLHVNFADILNTVENPTRGPRYQNAVNQETGKRYGSRMKVRIGKNSMMRIDRWWKLHRLKALRRILAGGFLKHWEVNEVVFDSLPIMISNER